MNNFSCPSLKSSLKYLVCAFMVADGMDSSSMGWKLHVEGHILKHPQCPAQCLGHHGHPDGPPITCIHISPHPTFFPCAQGNKRSSLEVLVGLFSRTLFPKQPRFYEVPPPPPAARLCSEHWMSLSRKRANPRHGQLHLQNSA